MRHSPFATTLRACTVLIALVVFLACDVTVQWTTWNDCRSAHSILHCIWVTG